MKEEKHFQPTESELEILQVLWEKQPCSVRLIHEQISAKRAAEKRDAIGYTTILKQVQRMLLDKGMVEREKDGKSHLYTAVPKEIEIQQTLSSQLLKTAYKGSALKLAMHALGQSKTSKEELEELRKWLDQQKEK
ncbi:MAG: BlaI/MecI/CopY family transcriptional regulator [Bacteroidota bacterium]